jgi:DNA-binding transcriptional regulator YiaG
MKAPTPAQVVEFRVVNNLTQVQLGKLIHVTERQVRNWEHNKFKMPLGLWELAHLKLGVKLRR